MAELDGPRALARAERPALLDLVGRVFRPEMRDDYAPLYADANLDNCRAVFDGPRPVSFIAYRAFEARLGGARVRLACLGSVATDPDYRGRGLATRVLEDCEARMVASGVHGVLISGARTLYTRQGARRVGRWTHFRVTPAEAGRLAASGIEVAPARKRADALEALNAEEPVAWVRSSGHWAGELATGVCENHPATPYLVLKGGRPAAYLVVHATRGEAEKAENRVCEWAGPRALVAGALARVAKLQPVACFQIKVPGHDATMRAALEGAGLAGEAAPGQYTLKVLDPAALWRAALPLARERAGGLADEVGVRLALNGRFEFRLGPDALALDWDALPRAFFGDADGADREWFASAGRLGEALARALPLPCLRYGYNYV